MAERPEYADKLWAYVKDQLSDFELIGGQITVIYPNGHEETWVRPDDQLMAKLHG